MKEMIWVEVFAIQYTLLEDALSLINDLKELGYQFKVENGKVYASLPQA